MFFIKCEHIRTISHNMGNGITEPKFAISDDNVQMVIKVLNGPEGNLVLFNEYFCYRLAILLDIKMPISGICYVDNITNDINNLIEADNLGNGFYSTYLPKAAPLMETIISQMKNKTDFYKILLFDHIIFNKDRNRGNLLVRYYKSDISLKVIDHTHVFVNQAIWDSNCLKQGMIDKDYRSTKILEHNEYLYGMFFRCLPFNRGIVIDIIKECKEKITLDNMVSIIKDIPNEWLPEEKDIDMLIKYILYRVDHLEDICITIENHRK